MAMIELVDYNEIYNADISLRKKQLEEAVEAVANLKLLLKLQQFQKKRNKC